MTAKRKVTFPHFANYYVPIKYLVTRGLDADYITPPPMTRRTLELGALHSPDYVCAPFKLNLGCFIEALELGADTLVQLGGVCRLGFYGELHEQILRDLGYEFDFVNLARASGRNPKSFYDEARIVSPELSLPKATAAFLTALKMVRSIDEVEDFIRQNVGFEADEGNFDRVHQNYLDALSHIDGQKELKYLHQNYMKRFKAIEVQKPRRPLRVGVVGEYYSIMDGFSNHFIEKEMARKGVIVERWMNVTNSLFHYDEKDLLPKIRGYSKYNMGATAMATVERALKFAKRGYDGIIHLKSFGCTPEVDAMPVLQNISQDYKIPVLHFSFDSQTADAGIQTRLEAFYDMMIMRKGSKYR